MAHTFLRVCLCVRARVYVRVCTVPVDHEDGELQLALLHMALSDDSSYALSPYLRYQVLFAMVGRTLSSTDAQHLGACTLDGIRLRARSFRGRMGAGEV